MKKNELKSLVNKLSGVVYGVTPESQFSDEASVSVLEDALVVTVEELYKHADQEFGKLEARAVVGEARVENLERELVAAQLLITQQQEVIAKQKQAFLDLLGERRFTIDPETGMVVERPQMVVTTKVDPLEAFCARMNIKKEMRVSPMWQHIQVNQHADRFVLHFKPEFYLALQNNDACRGFLGKLEARAVDRKFNNNYQKNGSLAIIARLPMKQQTQERDI